MKRLLLFLSILFSCIFSFACGSKEAQTYHLIKEALEHKILESGIGVVSNEEIKEILQKEKIFLLKDGIILRFKNAQQRVLALTFSYSVGLGVVGWLLLSRRLSSLKTVIKYGMITECTGYACMNCLGAYLLRVHSFWFKTVRLKLSGYQSIVESKIFNKNDMDYGLQFLFLSRIGRLDIIEEWHTLLTQNYNIAYSEGEMPLLQELQKLYPDKYPNANFLKIDFAGIKARKAAQALVADTTYADGTVRRRNVTLATELQNLLV
ncbi:hypothetical protein KAZ82_02630 [Candidatus Babeliales bacterium]|nr:hypothetical protein [Candidatus Babeliales bacterium]